MVHTDQHIKLVVKRSELLASAYLTLTFERPHTFNYQAGDWIDIAYGDHDLRGGKTYSLSSSPSEETLAITFKQGLSPLKQALASAQPNDTLTISQYGNDYGFQLNENKSSTLIAGGVGIAPFRSMLKDMADQGYKNDVQLIYLNQTDDFLFQRELESWQKQLAHLSVHYIVTKDMNRKQREKVLKSIITDVGRRYYIAGPPGMVTSTLRYITDLGVEPRDIRIDSFTGY
jgi:ferredoxin-NADP reductase